MSRIDQWQRSIVIGAAAASAVQVLACSGELQPAPSVEGGGVSAEVQVAADGTHPGDRSRLGEGFLVWESNRSGDWRIWIRSLAEGDAEQLSPDEDGRQHCCAHISPDGSAISYVSMELSKKAFSDAEKFGDLHLIDPAGENDRIVAKDAHAYFENRAAVWSSSTELIYIGAGRRTQLLDLESGEGTVLIDEPADGFGKLVNATLTHATSGVPTFDPYDRETGLVAPRRDLGGCQPYFTHDGRSGFWTAGGGGPFRRIDLESRAVTTLLRKGDERLPADRAYIYFPMYSRDGRLLAYSASGGEHSHFTADYDVFVVETDPESLEIIERPIRMTNDAGTDRFPDVYQVPLPLGRATGEAPLTVRFTPPSEGPWTWDFGDGAEEVADTGLHIYERPGSYSVLARSDGELLRGRVVVRPARPPSALAAEVRGGREVIIRFDEPVTLSEFDIRFDSGRTVREVSSGPTDESLRVELDEPFAGFDRVHVAGVEDRSQRPNLMKPTVLDIEPPLWPSRRDGLVFLWSSGDAPNLVDDLELGAARACSLQPHGLARLDHYFRMRLGAGGFSAGLEAGSYLVRRCQAKNEISLEVVLTPKEAPRGRTKVLVTSADHRGANLVLAQRDGRLAVQIRTIPRAGGNPWVELMPIEFGATQHLVVTFATHQLTAYLDGVKKVESDIVRGDLFHWRPRDLYFGSNPAGGQSWRGALEGVAVYSRVLGEDEVLENVRRHREHRSRRPAVEQLVVDARLIEHSEAPTLEEISPYREALMTLDYEVEAVIVGSFRGERIRVARWAILDGKLLPAADSSPGEFSRLTLEPFEKNPQLESVYLADSLPTDDPEPLYYAVTP